MGVVRVGRDHFAGLLVWQESFRRHLEEVEPACETFSAAAFFNVAMYHRGASERDLGYRARTRLELNRRDEARPIGTHAGFTVREMADIVRRVLDPACRSEFHPRNIVLSLQ